MAKPRVPEKLQAWIEARRRYRLSHAHVQMARELGMNPKELDGREMNVRGEAAYIIERAMQSDARIVTLGPLVFFSTETGDAWMLDPADHLALRLARGGDPLPADIIETAESFAIPVERQRRPRRRDLHGYRGLWPCDLHHRVPRPRDSARDSTAEPTVKALWRPTGGPPARCSGPAARERGRLG